MQVGNWDGHRSSLRRLSVPLEQKCREEIVGVASVGYSALPCLWADPQCAKAISTVPSCENTNSFGHLLKFEMHWPSLSKFLSDLYSASRETAKRSGAPSAGGRHKAGLSAGRCFCSEQHGGVGLKSLLLCADMACNLLLKF